MTTTPPPDEFWPIIADIIAQADREAREWPNRKYCEVQLIRPEVEVLRRAYTTATTLTTTGSGG